MTERVDNLFRPRVLMVTVRADPGGGPEHMWRLIRACQGDIACFVACPNDVPYQQRFIDVVGIKRVIEIPHRKFSLVALWHLIKFARRQRIDIVHSHGKGGGLYGRLTALFSRARAVHTNHGIHIGDYGRLMRLVYVAIERFLSCLTAKIIVVSNGEAAQVAKLRMAATSRLAVVKNGVVITDNPRKHPDRWQRPLRVLTMTRFNNHKNPELLLQIIKKLSNTMSASDIRFVVLGAGEGKNTFETKLIQDKLTDYVDLVGFVEQPQPYFSNVLCYLSTSRWEGMPLALLEALVAGVPIVATRVTGNEDVVEHEENGFLFDVDDADSAVSCIKKLVSSPQRVAAMSDNAWAAAKKNYSVTRMARETITVYESVLKSVDSQKMLTH